MFELIQAGANTYYFDVPVKIGVYVQENKDAYLIDTGNDKDAGRKIFKAFQEKGWNLKGIINTHSNADHIGGNAFLQNKTGCPIFTKDIEATITKYPIIEPAFLYGGYPFKELRNKFLMAKESNAFTLDHEDFPKELEVLELPGHYFHMIGIRTPDNVVFLADSLFSEHILSKYHVSFMYDVKAFFETLKSIEEMSASLFIPAHAEATADINPLVEINRSKVLEILDKLQLFAGGGNTQEEIMKKAFDEYSLVMDPNQYVLVGSSIRSYLSYLKDEGKLDIEFLDNRLLWKKASNQETTAP